ncbi:hypothetical protein ApDm4_2715 [Acetobacter pomorum]|nr:hypothetical protein ApDm4_2715 [Acetobacter pomorum]
MPGCSTVFGRSGPCLRGLPYFGAKLCQQEKNDMSGSISPSEITRLQTALRRLLGSEKLTINPAPRAGMSVELAADGEVIGTIHRDDEDGDVSYAVNIVVLEEDLPAAK